MDLLLEKCERSPLVELAKTQSQRLKSSNHNLLFKTEFTLS